MRKQAFTLPELLVVIGIIVVLVSMLLPSINRAWASAQFVNCQSNLRQLGLANQLYVNDNHGYLPFANWNPQGAATPIAYCNATIGWLYTCQNPQPAFTADTVQTGSLWAYLTGGERLYHCPAHILGDEGNYQGAMSDVMTSYLMNGAINAYGAAKGPPQGPSGLPPAYFFKITQFNPDDALMWEAAEEGIGAYAGWNDGGTYPNESYNPSGPQGTRTRHTIYLSLLSMDGHVEPMSTKDYWTLASISQSPRWTQNRLWCRPDTMTGH